MAAVKPKIFVCNFPNCYQSFKSVKKLVNHKIEELDHHYCPHCNLNFENFDKWVEHKALMTGQEINSLRLWERDDAIRRAIRAGGSDVEDEGDGSSRPKPRLQHLCCKFCGMDFESLGGRNDHVKQHHPFPQVIRCPACKGSFSRPSELIHHYENGLCPKISEEVFVGFLTHKSMVKQLLSDPELMAELTALDFSEVASDQAVDGGVRLDSALDDLGPSLQPPLQPLINPKVASPQDQAELSTLMAETNLERQQDRGQKLKAPPRELQIQPMKPTPSPSPYASNSADLPSIQRPRKTSTKAQLLPSNTANNPIIHQFWNPVSGDYSPERFYNPVIELYRCPFQACDFQTALREIFTSHLSSAHRPVRTPCPSCRRRFDTRAALISHFEAPFNGRCRIARAEAFEAAVDEYTGGFVKASVEDRSDFSRELDGVTITYVKYEGVRPPGLVGFEFAEGQEGQRVRVGRRVGTDDGGDGW